MSANPDEEDLLVFLEVDDIEELLYGEDTEVSAIVGMEDGIPIREKAQVVNLTRGHPWYTDGGYKISDGRDGNPLTNFVAGAIAGIVGSIVVYAMAVQWEEIDTADFEPAPVITAELFLFLGGIAFLLLVVGLLLNYRNRRASTRAGDSA